MKKPKATKTGKSKPHPKNPNETILEYTNGEWRYDGKGEKTKGALALKPEWLVPFTPETGLAATEIKKDRRRELFERASVRAGKAIVPDMRIRTPDDAAEFLIERHYEQGAASDATASLASAKWIVDGILGTTKKDKGPGVLHIHLDNATINARSQTKRMIEEFEADIIEGEYVEG